MWAKWQTDGPLVQNQSAEQDACHLKMSEGEKNKILLKELEPVRASYQEDNQEFGANILTVKRQIDDFYQ